MLRYPTALRILREKGDGVKANLKDGVVLEKQFGDSRVFLFYKRTEFMSVTSGSMYEFYVGCWGAEILGEFINLAKKYGPPAGLAMSKRGGVCFGRGLLADGMIFNRNGILTRDVAPERFRINATEPDAESPEYKIIYSGDDEQPNQESRNEQVQGRARVVEVIRRNRNQANMRIPPLPSSVLDM